MERKTATALSAIAAFSLPCRAHDLWLRSAEATLHAGAGRGILGRRFLRRRLERGWARLEAAPARIGLAGTTGGTP